MNRIKSYFLIAISSLILLSCNNFIAPKHKTEPADSKYIAIHGTMEIPSRTATPNNGLPGTEFYYVELIPPANSGKQIIEQAVNLQEQTKTPSFTINISALEENTEYEVYLYALTESNNKEKAYAYGKCSATINSTSNNPISIQLMPVTAANDGEGSIDLSVEFNINSSNHASIEKIVSSLHKIESTKLAPVISDIIQSPQNILPINKDSLSTGIYLWKIEFITTSSGQDTTFYTHSEIINVWKNCTTNAWATWNEGNSEWDYSTSAKNIEASFPSNSLNGTVEFFLVKAGQDTSTSFDQNSIPADIDSCYVYAKISETSGTEFIKVNCGSTNLNITESESNSFISETISGYNNKTISVTITSQDKLKSTTKEINWAPDGVYISKDGDDTTGNGTYQNPYKTFHKALNSQDFFTGTNENLQLYILGNYKVDENDYIGYGSTDTDKRQFYGLVELSTDYTNSNRKLIISGLHKDRSTVVDFSELNNNSNATINSTDSEKYRGRFLCQFGENFNTEISNLTIIDSTGGSRTRLEKGGAIYQEKGTVTLKNVEIRNFAAETAGAIYSWNGATLTMSDCIITGCNATNNGGAIFSSKRDPADQSDPNDTNNTTYTTPSLTISSTNFSNCSATNGGAIYGNDCKIELTDSEIIDNYASVNGGGLFIQNNYKYSFSNTKIPVNLSNTKINSNKCLLSGAGFYCAKGTISTLINCEVTNNIIEKVTDTLDTTEIDIPYRNERESTSSIKINNSHFAAGAGIFYGATSFYLDANDLPEDAANKLINCKILNNRINYTSSETADKTYLLGAGICVFSDLNIYNYLRITDTEIADNSIESTSQNVEAFGAGIATYSIVVLNSGYIHNNEINLVSGKAKGAGVFMLDSATSGGNVKFNLIDGTIDSNTATVNSGTVMGKGIFSSSQNELRIEGGTVASNNDIYLNDSQSISIPSQTTASFTITPYTYPATEQDTKIQFIISDDSSYMPTDKIRVTPYKTQGVTKYYKVDANGYVVLEELDTSITEFIISDTASFNAAAKAINAGYADIHCFIDTECKLTNDIQQMNVPSNIDVIMMPEGASATMDFSGVTKTPFNVEGTIGFLGDNQNFSLKNCQATLFEIHSGELSFANVELSGNSGTNGGVIKQTGGKVYLHGAFTNNTCSGNGGVINSTNGFIRIDADPKSTDSIFSGNSATNGGFIYADSSTIEFYFMNEFGDYQKDDYIQISNNTATESGGAIYLTGNSTLTLSTGIWKNNMALAGSGGAIYIDSKAEVNFNKILESDNKTYPEAKILSNFAETSGGAIYNGGLLNLTRGLLYSNYCKTKGAAIHNKGKLNFTGGVIYNNYFVDQAGENPNSNIGTLGSGIFHESSEKLSIGGSALVVYSAEENGSIFDAVDPSGSLIFPNEIVIAQGLTGLNVISQIDIMEELEFEVVAYIDHAASILTSHELLTAEKFNGIFQTSLKNEQLAKFKATRGRLSGGTWWPL